MKLIWIGLVRRRTRSGVLLLAPITCVCLILLKIKYDTNDRLAGQVQQPYVTVPNDSQLDFTSRFILP